MATVDQFEAALKPFKLALCEAFGLDPDKTARDMSVDTDSVTFKQVGVNPDLPDLVVVQSDGIGNVTTVEFPAVVWTSEQRRAVDAYLGQFPLRFSVADVPEALREDLWAAPPDDGGIEIGQAVRGSAAPLTEERMEGLYAYASGLASGWHGPKMALAGEAMIDLWVEADRLQTMLEPQPAATWRDVVRAMRAAGFKLKVEEREARYRKWWVDEGTGGIIAEVWREMLGGRYTWTVQISGYLLRHVTLSDPEPAAVLAAAMLTRLIDGPVCGVDVTGLAEFTRRDQL